MDAIKVDQVMQYALAVAARADDAWAHELGAIHLLKLVYLADLAYAERHGGETFTGAPWTFFNYGPWSQPVFERVMPVVAQVGADERRFSSSKYENDSVRWAIPDPEDAETLLDRTDSLLPIEVASKVRWAVRTFGNDTTALLHFVYTTAPMLRAAPHEQLTFIDLGEPGHSVERQEEPQRTAKQMKRSREALSAIRQEAQQLLAAKLAKQAQMRAVSPAPRYDEVFAQGQRWLDQAAGGDAEELKGEVTFPEDIWRSSWRSGHDGD